MPKCSACRRTVAAADSISCNELKCTNVFHKECVKVSRTGTTVNDWSCPECKAKIPRDNRTGTPVTGISKCNVATIENTEEATSVDMITRSEHLTMIRELRAACSEFKAVVAELKNEVLSLTGAVNACSARMDNIEKRLELIESARNEERSSDKVITSLQETVNELKSEINDRNQNDLLNDIEITGITESQGDNIIHTILLLATKLGVALAETDIVWARRAGPRRRESDARARPVYVRLTRRALRDSLIKAARVRRGLSNTDTDARIYVNERLTYINKGLFLQTRLQARKYNFRFTWSKEGKIFVREKEGKPARRIRSATDFEEVFGTTGDENRG